MATAVRAETKVKAPVKQHKRLAAQWRHAMTEAGFALDKAATLSTQVVSSGFGGDALADCVNLCYATALDLLCSDYAQGCKNMRGLTKLDSMITKSALKLSKPIDKGLQQCAWTALLTFNQAIWCVQTYNAKVHSGSSGSNAPEAAAAVQAVSCPGLANGILANKAACRLQSLIAQLEAQQLEATFELQAPYLLLIMALKQHMWALRLEYDVGQEKKDELMQRKIRAHAAIDVGRCAHKAAGLTGKMKLYHTARLFCERADQLGYFNESNSAELPTCEAGVTIDYDEKAETAATRESQAACSNSSIIINTDLIMLGDVYLWSGNFEAASRCFFNASQNKDQFAKQSVLTKAMFAAITGRLNFEWQNDAKGALTNYQGALQMLAALDQQLKNNNNNEGRNEAQTNLVEVSLARASIYCGIGVVYAASDATSSNALKWLGYALKHFRSIARNTLHEAKTFFEIGVVYAKFGSHEQALTRYVQALGIVAKQDPNSLEEARIRFSCGSTLYSMDRLYESRDHLQQALALYLAQSPASLETSKTHATLGMVFEQYNLLDDALKHYQAAIAVAEAAAPNGTDHVSAMIYAADVLGDLGRYDEAVAHLALALRCINASPSVFKNQDTPIIVHKSIGELRIKQNDYKGARRHFAEAWKVVKSSGSTKTLTAAYLLDDIGNLHADEGDLAAALKFYEAALANKRLLASGSIDEATTLDLTGNLFKTAGDWSAALVNYLCAYKIFIVCRPDSVTYARSLHNIGDMLMRISQTQCKDIVLQKLHYSGTADEVNDGAQARRRIDPVSLALSYYRKVFTIQNADTLNTVVQETEYKIGTVLYAQGNLEAALQHFGAALSLDDDTPHPESAIAEMRASLLTSVGDLCVDANCYDGAVSFFQAALDAQQLQLQLQQQQVESGRDTLTQLEQRPPAAATTTTTTTKKEACKPVALALLKTLGRLGKVHELKQDLATAIDYYQRAVESAEKHAPESMQHADALNDYGRALCCVASTDSKGAACVQRSNVIRRNCTLDMLTRTLTGLAAAEARVQAGKLCVLTGDGTRAVELFSDARKVFEESAAQQTKPYADALFGIGASCEANGDFESALKLYRQSVPIYRSVAPGSKDLQIALHKTGTLLTQLSQLTDKTSLDNALSCLSESLQLLQTPTL